METPSTQATVVVSAERGVFPYFAVNVGAILAAGVGASAWLLHYTELFPEIGGVLALGGLASWLAFVSRIISEERQKAFQRWVDQRVLSRPFVLAGVLVVNMVFAGAASFRGTISAESLSGGAQRAAWVHLPGEGRGDPEYIPPGGVLKVNVAARPGSASTYLVKVSGYPDREVEVRPWRVTRVYVPVDFTRRPVVVLRPDPGLIHAAMNNQPMELHLELRRGGTLRKLTAPFDGHALWVGCDADVEVPERLRASWRAVLEASGNPALLHYWLQPQPLEGGVGDRLALQPGDEIAFRIVFRGNDYTPEKVASVAPVGALDAFLQTEVIHDPDDS